MVATLFDIPPTMSSESRRTDERAGQALGLGVRTRVRVTYAEAPELYLREEMS
jgi:hypothetical protein